MDTIYILHLSFLLLHLLRHTGPADSANLPGTGASGRSASSAAFLTLPLRLHELDLLIGMLEGYYSPIVSFLLFLHITQHTSAVVLISWTIFPA